MKLLYIQETVHSYVISVNRTVRPFFHHCHLSLSRAQATHNGSPMVFVSGLLWGIAEGWDFFVISLCRGGVLSFRLFLVFLGFFFLADLKPRLVLLNYQYPLLSMCLNHLHFLCFIVSLMSDTWPRICDHFGQIILWPRDLKW